VAWERWQGDSWGLWYKQRLPLPSLYFGKLFVMERISKCHGAKGFGAELVA